MRGPHHDPWRQPRRWWERNVKLPELIVAFVMGAVGCWFAGWLLHHKARAFDFPATESTPAYPGNPGGQVVEPEDPCGGNR